MFLTIVDTAAADGRGLARAKLGDHLPSGHSRFEKPEFSSPADSSAKKSPQLAGISRTKKEILQNWQSVAGDAVQIAPVSVGIPCKQGILQGISGFRDPVSRADG